MCYTSTTSINAFTIGIISSILLIIKGILQRKKQLKIIGIFFIFVTLMQLYDYIFWTNPPTTPSSSKINEITTKLACVTNHLQPIILALLFYYFNKKLSQSSTILISIYTISILIYTINGWNKLKYTGVTTKSYPSLNWQWNHLEGAKIIYVLFLLSLAYLFFDNLNYPINIVASLATVLTFAYSIYKYNNNLSSGRFWCYFAAFVPLIFLLF
jgi:hypothetical protein